MLEQYQAQISSALAPAFTDSHPLVTCIACEVAAIYIGSGINQDLSTLSRLLKLLGTLLETFEGKSFLLFSDEYQLVKLSNQAKTMLRISVSTGKFPN